MNIERMILEKKSNKRKLVYQIIKCIIKLKEFSTSKEIHLGNIIKDPVIGATIYGNLAYYEGAISNQSGEKRFINNIGKIYYLEKIV